LFNNIYNRLAICSLHIYPGPLGWIKHLSELHETNGGMNTGIRLPENGDFAVCIFAIVGFYHH
jgi:hypothetical protein